MSFFFQIKSQPELYAIDAQVSWASNTTLSITSGQFRNSDNSNDIVDGAPYNTFPITLNAATTGLNALDNGSLAASTWYKLYVIGSSKKDLPLGYLLSKFINTEPKMPAGYDIYRVIDYQLTDGSSHLLKFYNAGKYTSRVKYWDTLIASDVTSGSFDVFDSVSLLNGMPLVSGLTAILQVKFTPATAADYVILSINDNTGSGFNISSVVASKQQQIPVEMQTAIGTVNFIETPFVLYKNSAASCATGIYIIGFRYNI